MSWIAKQDNLICRSHLKRRSRRSDSKPDEWCCQAPSSSIRNPCQCSLESLGSISNKMMVSMRQGALDILESQTTEKHGNLIKGQQVVQARRSGVEPAMGQVCAELLDQGLFSFLKRKEAQPVAEFLIGIDLRKITQGLRKSVDHQKQPAPGLHLPCGVSNSEVRVARMVHYAEAESEIVVSRLIPTEQVDLPRRKTIRV